MHDEQAWSKVVSQMWRPAPQDWLLTVLVRTAERAERTFAVTLNVGGLIITGEVVSEAKYFEALNEAMRLALAFAPESPGPLDPVIEELRASKTDDQEVQHIHLIDAQIFAPGTGLIPTNGGVPWRGRLSAVDGFIVGRLKIGDQAAQPVVT